MGLWIGGSAMNANMGDHVPATVHKDQVLYARVKDLEHHIGRLTLLNQALWELLRNKLNLTDAELEAIIHDVDLRDGVADGKITETPLACPTCGRISNSRHYKCLYCGQEFERPVMG